MSLHSPVSPSLALKGLSISRQCELLDITRSTYYEHLKCDRNNKEEKEKENAMINKVSDAYSSSPTYGYKKMSNYLLSKGEEWATEKRIRSLYKKLGYRGLTATFRTTRSSKHPYGRAPYLLKDRPIRFVNEVWATDITYIDCLGGQRYYYTAVIDLYSRKILASRLSDRMDVRPCMEAVEEAIMKYGIPAIFNSDQGSQYTSESFVKMLESYGIRVSNDGRGRWRDNVYVERTWKTVKYEWLFLREYHTREELEESLDEFQTFYNDIRVHQALDYKTPDEIYKQGCFPVEEKDTKEGKVGA